MPAAIDLNHLNQYVCGDAALLDEILTIFEGQADLWLARLDPAQTDEEWRNACHALKGASRGIGAFAVGDLCEKGERLIGSAADEPRKRVELLAELRRKLAGVVEEARRIRDGQWLAASA
jgi:HPt (histidine-containing phosphotransfer) domain-containing protein